MKWVNKPTENIYMSKNDYSLAGCWINCKNMCGLDIDIPFCGIKHCSGVYK